MLHSGAKVKHLQEAMKQPAINLTVYIANTLLIPSPEVQQLGGSTQYVHANTLAQSNLPITSQFLRKNEAVTLNLQHKLYWGALGKISFS